ncbi:hypothetical protein DVH24_032435 [Malus domestica]|uniref:Uncharacterized protein n=1 Tax=Malus domestica TaxID=3750 RepID=A0A498J3C1_MALDO|nr:hypothetical protein DVH24_032435 [Malus domestica]
MSVSSFPPDLPNSLKVSNTDNNPPENLQLSVPRVFIRGLNTEALSMVQTILLPNSLWILSMMKKALNVSTTLEENWWALIRVSMMLIKEYLEHA